ncbi:MAG: hypothetical protein ACYCTY_08870 [Sulfuricella sp.]
MSNSKKPNDVLRAEILKICRNQFRSLGDICEILQANKNTIRAGYIYPMVREKLLLQELPSGTKSAQRYKTANRKNSLR